MNTIRILAVGLLSVWSVTAVAQEQKSVFNVSGNCTMCKKRIEKAVQTLPGVNSFEWNVKTKKAEVTFDHQQVSAKSVQQKIADAGHDTEDFKAPAASYNRLPACCKYERNTPILTSPIKIEK